MKKLEQYIDSYGCIIRREYGDLTGGDSLSYAGFNAVLAHCTYLEPKKLIRTQALGHYLARIDLHIGENGILVRHPRKDAPQWSDYRFTSRDQYMPNVAYWCLSGLHDFGRNHLRQLWKNKFFYWNRARFKEGKIIDHAKSPDFVGFDQIGVVLRSCGFWWLYPLYFVTDFFGLLSSVWKVLYAFWYPSHTDDQTRICLLIAQTRKYPTPIAFLSKWIYKLRPGWELREPYIHLNDPWWMFKKELRSQVLRTFKYRWKINGPRWAMETRFGRESEPPFDVQFKLADF